MKKIILFLFVFLSFESGFAATYTYILEIQPSDSTIIIDGKEYKGKSAYKSKQKEIRIEVSKEGYKTRTQTVAIEKNSKKTEIKITLELQSYPVSISSVYNIYPSNNGIPKNFRIIIDGSEVPAVQYYNYYNSHPNWFGEGLTFSGDLTHGRHQITFSALNHPDYTFPLTITGPYKIMIRHPQVFSTGDLKITPTGIFDCGKSPKQTDISPDDKYIYTALLDDEGFQVFDVEKKEIVSYIKPDNYSKYKCFVEGLFIPAYHSYFVSQMASSSIFEYDVSDFSNPVFRRRISVEGNWTKVIAYAPGQDLLAVSNWISGDVSLVDYKTGKVVGHLSGMKEPRGLTFSNNGKYLYVTAYAGGGINKYNTKTWALEASIAIPYSAMRHARISADDKFLYVNDMALSNMHKIDTETFTIIKTIKTDIYPNTFDITDDGKYMFVSTRGPNNPASYMKKSLEPGFVDIIDLSTFSMIGRITAGSQPTGLDVSSDGKFFVVSNFQDHTFELYSIEYPQ